MICAGGGVPPKITTVPMPPGQGSTQHGVGDDYLDVDGTGAPASEEEALAAVLADQAMRADSDAVVFEAEASGDVVVPNIQKIPNPPNKSLPVVARPVPEVELEDDDLAPEESLDREEPTLVPSSYFKLLSDELGRVVAKYESIKNTLPAGSRAEYDAEIGTIRERLTYWSDQIRFMEGQLPVAKIEYAKDIEIGERILLDRVLAVGAALYSNPVREKLSEGAGLHTPRRFEDRGARETDIIPALVNHDVGYGRALLLRPHQEDVLRDIKGRLVQTIGRPGLPREMLQGTVVMPTGGGKTRVMVAGFAAGIELGLFRLGDKYIILNRTTQIHKQNKKVAGLLSEYFRKMFGRDIRITEYKAENKDVSGDVIAVSLDSIGEEEQRAEFERALSAELEKTGGRIAMAAVDEIHHLGMSKGKTKGMWREAAGMLRRISPDLYRVGFTATPTWGEEERPYIARIRPAVLMRRRVTPRTYVVKVDGVELDQLKISKGASDFNTSELVSVLLEHPERNRKIYEVLEKTGLGNKIPTPSGKDRLEGVLAFAGDLKHASMMAREYVNYFGQPGSGFKGRKLTAIGLVGGIIYETQLLEAIGNYRAGKTDGIVAVVSGSTPDTIRDKILEAVSRGEIEAVVNVDVYYEGADLYMFTHLIGGRPTFSMIRKGQEGGRLNRRAEKDVSINGKLLSDSPKILYDVVDHYNSYRRKLFTYAELLGVTGYASAKPGEIFDAMTEKVVDDVDRTGGGKGQASKPDKTKPDIPKPEVGIDSVLSKLWEIFETKYHGDVENMAMDLGIPVEEMQEILKGKGWINKRWFLRRVATLIYESRDVLVDVYNEERGRSSVKLEAQDYAVIRGALSLYQQWAGPISEITGVFIEGDVGWGKMTARIPGYNIKLARETALTDYTWRRTAAGLLIYFGAVARVAGERQAGAEKEYQALIDRVFKRENWVRDLTTAEGRLRNEARILVAVRYGGKFPQRLDGDIAGLPPQNTTSPLTRWLKGEDVLRKKGSNVTGKSFYFRDGQIALLLEGLGMSNERAEQLLLESVFERNGWSFEAKTAMDKILLAARIPVARRFGGTLTKDHGIPGVDPQHAHAPATIWLNTGRPSHKRPEGAGPKSGFFGQEGQVRPLLIGFGMAENDIDKMIIDVVFEFRGWTKDLSTAEARLKFAVRKTSALMLGDWPAGNLGIKDLSFQNDKSALRQWMDTGKFVFGKNRTATDLYGSSENGGQVRLFLESMGVKKEDVDALIVDAVFELDPTWPREAKTSEEALLLTIRRRVAIVYGGQLPVKMPGLPPQEEGAILYLWFNGKPVPKKIGYDGSKHYSASKCYGRDGQVRKFAFYLGMNKTEIDQLILDTVFEREGWPKTAAGEEEAKRLKVRTWMAMEYGGGRLPYYTGIEGVKTQQSFSILTRWIAGDLTLENSIQLESQISALLKHIDSHP